MGRSKHSKAAVKFEISPQMGKKDSQSHFGISSMGQHFKDIDLSPARSKSSLDGFGITVEDSGHLLIA
uniref:Predicted protein n=1 Tax=Hordeum vulgare subsp. vulgare TaxID=112509 RepID=F2DX76_HORVV|nr:predicted protein [Hordeum vulgare subsp. vulgare]